MQDWNEIKFVFAGPRDETAIKQFLEANGLLHQLAEHGLCGLGSQVVAGR